MTLFTSETPELSNQVSTPIDFPIGDQGSAFSQELFRLSQQPTPVEQIAQTTTPTELSTAPNPAVDALPPLSVDATPPLSGDATAATGDAAPPLAADQQAPQSAPHLDGVTDAAVDFGLGVVAVAGAEVVVGILTKNPEFLSMAAKTVETGGKYALLTSPKFLAPVVLPHVAALGAATVGRHYAVEAVTGKSESWLDSANHAGFGIGEAVLGRWVVRTLNPVWPPAVGKF